MAKINLPVDNINFSEIKLTKEYLLVKNLANKLTDEFEVYFNPFFNGDTIDLIIIRKNFGVIIIKVNHLNLKKVFVDEENNWHFIDSKKTLICSPFQEVENLKNNLFRFHINKLAEKNIFDSKVEKSIKAYVYFDNKFIESLNSIFDNLEISIKNMLNNLKINLNNQILSKNEYKSEKALIKNFQKMVGTNKTSILTDQKINQVFNSNFIKNESFSDEIYKEFTKKLKERFHYSNQGKKFNYDKKQNRLTESSIGFQKIKGVAGSGKTTVLAKKAVNAYIRHNDTILVLTYNISLLNFIKNKIEEVEEDFPYSAFYVINYHYFINRELDRCGLSKKFFLGPIDNESDFEKIYSNQNLFEGTEHLLKKYKTILIDEVQDYLPAWIEILKKYFLQSDGEMVLFGDESQNIYNRKIDKNNNSIVKGFGRWERLTKSYRSISSSPVISLTKKFQQKFLLKKYDIDLIDFKPTPGVLPSFYFIDNYTIQSLSDSLSIIKIIYNTIVNKKLNHKDVCIISSNISILKNIDELLSSYPKIKTTTTFESKSQFKELLKENIRSAYFDKKIELLRRSKKIFFDTSQDAIKISTIHSFKGLESPTVFYILCNNDSEELVYASITRAKQNLIIIKELDNKFYGFFNKETTVVQDEQQELFGASEFPQHYLLS